MVWLLARNLFLQFSSRLVPHYHLRYTREEERISTEYCLFLTSGGNRTQAAAAASERLIHYAIDLLLYKMTTATMEARMAISRKIKTSRTISLFFGPDSEQDAIGSMTSLLKMMTSCIWLISLLLLY